MLSVNNIKKCHCASPITSAMYDYRQLLNNLAIVYIASNVSCSSETLVIFRVHIDVFVELLICGFVWIFSTMQCTIL